MLDRPANQLAILLFLALGLGLRKEYPTQVICLDDVMAAFDLNQLPRLCLILRQLAYGNGDYRRQIFLASHNEAFSAALVRYLTPPPGREMRVLNFEAFSRENGPRIKSYRVRPAEAPDKEKIFGHLKILFQ